jgi:hypothetical protein
VTAAGLAVALVAWLYPRSSTAPVPRTSPAASDSGPAVVVAAVRLRPSDAARNFAFPDVWSMSATDLAALDSALSTGDDSSYLHWADQHGGADIGLVRFQAVLAGGRQAPVRILDIRTVKKCSAALAGTVVVPAGGGPNPSTGIAFNLDRTDPKAQQITGMGAFEGTDYFAGHTISLARAEQQVFEFVVTTTRHYCQFALQLTILANGRTITQTVDNNGHQFRVTAPAPANGRGQFSGYGAVYSDVSAPTATDGTRLEEFSRENPTTFAG